MTTAVYKTRDLTQHPVNITLYSLKNLKNIERKLKHRKYHRIKNQPERQRNKKEQEVINSYINKKIVFIKITWKKLEGQNFLLSR